ncbi:cytochrome b [Oceaniserpentilla sp. 4NH20-0058]|uniref:cytochrome b n=1 Tax=Oceaniserpentilla sp. 4NH20-0058 TaxID=3127660 RepID=UPI0031026190
MNYTPLSKATVILHWLIAVGFLMILGVGLYMEELPRGPEKFELMGLHKSFGFAFLFLAAIRLGWRIKEGAISSIGEGPAWQEKAATGVHHLLLLATILMPISGLMMSIGGGYGVDFFGINILAESQKIEWLGGLGHEIHEILSKLAILAVLLHVAGGIKHQFIDKDGTISRMLGR